MTTTAPPPLGATRYTAGAIILHWTIAVLVVLQIASGLTMTQSAGDGTPLQFDLYQLHKSFGVTVLLLTLARVLWRVFNPPPPEPASVSRLEAIFARTVHFAFYGLLIAIPLTGWLMISVSSVDVPTVLFFTNFLPFPDLPWLGDLGAATRRALGEGGETAHGALAYLTLALLVLHIAGAVKHHLADGRYIARMGWGGAGARRARGRLVAALVPLAILCALVAAATFTRDAAPPASPDAAPVAAVPEAANAVPAASTPAAGGAMPWTVDREASTLTFTVQHNGASVSGGFRAFEAGIVFAADDLANSSIDVTIDTTSAYIRSSEISLQHLAGSDGFDNRAYGTARFTAETIRTDGADYVADGVLEIRGHALPQSLRFSLRIDGDEARAEGRLGVDRLDYGIGADIDEKAETLGATVSVDVVVVARREDG